MATDAEWIGGFLRAYAGREERRATAGARRLRNELARLYRRATRLKTEAALTAFQEACARADRESADREVVGSGVRRLLGKEA